MKSCLAARFLFFLAGITSLLLMGFPTMGQTARVKKPAEIIKLGTIDCDLVETTPIVFNKKVYRFEYVRERYWDNHTGDSYFRFVSHKKKKPTASFAAGFHLGSAYVHRKNVIVTGVDDWGADKIHIFTSSDLDTWDQWVAFELPGYQIFNTSLIHDGKRYVLMFEIGGPLAGVGFTARFATSPDLKHWDVLPESHNYAMDRYTAPHCLRYLDGYYYNFYLEMHHGFEMRVVRSQDFLHWEASALNPVLRSSPDDKKIFNAALDKQFHSKIAKADNTNNSDLDFCEYRGKLIINYSWGNQMGAEFLAEAYYDGTAAQFLRSWFPE